MRLPILTPVSSIVTVKRSVTLKRLGGEGKISGARLTDSPLQITGASDGVEIMGFGCTVTSISALPVHRPCEISVTMPVLSVPSLFAVAKGTKGATIPPFSPLSPPAAWLFVQLSSFRRSVESDGGQEIAVA